ncbi:MAG: DUF2948 family protein [Dichotomicrobium sp.]
MTALKLLALDEEDLAVVAAHLQDAILRVQDMSYLPQQRRFAAVLNRFDWLDAERGEGRRGGYRRRQAALRFDRVVDAKIQNIDTRRNDGIFELLTVQFEPTDPPGGEIFLIFAGDAAIRLTVECIEAELRDLSAAWRARRKPEHGIDEGAAQPRRSD